MDAFILYSRAHAAFRLGKTGLHNNSCIIHADTLFSALIHLASMYMEEAELNDLISAFSEGKVQVSSAFHCLTPIEDSDEQDARTDEQSRSKKTPLFFLPRPTPWHHIAHPYAKTVKKVAFLSTGLWNSKPTWKTLLQTPVLGGVHAITWEELRMLSLEDSALVDEWEAALKGKDPEELKKKKLEKELEEYEKNFGEMSRYLASHKLYRQIPYPKVRVHTASQEAAYYHQTTLQLQTLPGQYRGEKQDRKQWKTHFYLLYRIDPSLKSSVPQEGEDLYTKLSRQLQTLIRLMADEGVGGDRSSGAGAFDHVSQQFLSVFPTPDSQAKQCLLSPAIPKDVGEFQAFEAYKTMIRGGGAIGRWKNPGTEVDALELKHRKQIRMIEEGAIFDGDLQGRIVDLAPEGHPIPSLRYGKIFSLPFFD